jgi:hypothetical protein
MVVSRAVKAARAECIPGNGGGVSEMRFIMALILLMIVFSVSAQNEQKKAEAVAK